MKSPTSKSTLKRQPRTAKTAPCPICGEHFNVMGLKNHIRLKHKLRLKTHVVDVPKNPVEAQAAEMITHAVHDAVTVALEANAGRFTPEEIAENRRKFFEPAADTNWAALWLKRYRRDPELAKRDWEELQALEARVPMAAYSFEDKRYALKCVLKIDGHSDGTE